MSDQLKVVTLAKGLAETVTMLAAIIGPGVIADINANGLKGCVTILVHVHDLVAGTLISPAAIISHKIGLCGIGSHSAVGIDDTTATSHAATKHGGPSSAATSLAVIGLVTTDGIHAYVVEINPTDEGSVIYYRILYPGEEEYTEWAVYEERLSFEGDGKHRVEAYAVAPGKLPSEQIAYEFVVEPEPPTSISEMMNGKTVAGVRYFNLAGQEMTEANGMTIVVTTYTDGTTSAVKVIK